MARENHIMTVVMLYIWLTSLTMICATTYTNINNRSVIVIPQDIPPSTTNLDLYDNAIAKTYPEDFRNLYNVSKINFYGNKIANFPNFTYIADTLGKLILTGNLLPFIPASLLNMLTKLHTFSVSGNLLTQFPDVPGPGNTMRDLYIASNPFPKGLPQMIYFAKTLTRLDATNIQITCDQRVMFMQTITYLSGSCSSPDSLRGTSLSGLTVSNLTAPVIPVEHSEANKGLPTINPNNIPLSVTHLDISNNTIANIHCQDFSRFSSIIQLNLRINELGKFPDFSCISDTLQILDLSSNAIDDIESNFLNNLVKLEVLHLENNKLTTIPNVAGPSNTLRELYISGNNFKIFPVISEIAHKLEYLYLDHNQIETFPSGNNLISKAPSSPQLVINLASNNLVTIPLLFRTAIQGFALYIYDNPVMCDSEIVWLLGMENVYIDGECAQPKSLKNRNLHSMTAHDIQEDDVSERAAFFEGNEMYSTLHPITTTAAPSIFECMSKCLSTFGCAYVNYKHPDPTDTSTENCHIGDVINGVRYSQIPDGRVGWMYHAVK